MASRYWKLVSLITTWHVAASLCFYAVSAGTPFFRQAFSLTGTEIGLVITVLMLGYAVFLLPFGVATDVFGERRVLTLGLMGLGIGSVFVAAVPSYGMLLPAVFFLGSQYGTATPGTNKAIFDNIETAREHRALGIKQVGPTVGSAIGAILITGTAGLLFWQAGFLIVGGVGLGVAVVFYTAYTRAATLSAPRPAASGIIRNRPYILLLAAGMCIGAVLYTTVGYTVLYVEEGIGAAVVIGGAALALLQVSSSIGRISVGWLADVLPGAPPARTGSILTVQILIGGILFRLITTIGTPVHAAVVLAALGFFALGSTGLYYSCISTIVADDDLGSASAGGQLAAVIGGLLTPPAFGYLIDTASYDAAWSLLGGISFVGAGLVALAVYSSDVPVRQR